MVDEGGEGRRGSVVVEKRRLVAAVESERERGTAMESVIFECLECGQASVFLEQGGCPMCEGCGSECEGVDDWR